MTGLDTCWHVRLKTGFASLLSTLTRFASPVALVRTPATGWPLVSLLTRCVSFNTALLIKLGRGRGFLVYPLPQVESTLSPDILENLSIRSSFLMTILLPDHFGSPKYEFGLNPVSTTCLVACINRSTSSGPSLI